MFFCILAQNEKSLHWGDPVDGAASEDPPPTQTSLPHQCETSQIRYLYVGTDIPAMRGRKKVDEKTAKMAFAILHEGDSEPLEFVAKSEEEYAIWLDGFRYFIGQDVAEKESLRAVDRLLR
jgi:hypothetical protein